MVVMQCKAAIHELPLHIVTEEFSTIDVFKKTKLLRCLFPKRPRYSQRGTTRRFLLFPHSQGEYFFFETKPEGLTEYIPGRQPHKR